MSNVLVKKTFLLAFMLLMMGVAGAQSLSFRNSFDISQGANLNTNFSMSSETGSPNGLTFNNDGTKYYVVEISNDQILQYSMSTAFDISTASYDGAFSVASQDTQPSGIAFNGDGSKVFIVGNSNSVHSYSLTSNYDITGTVVYDNTSFGVTSPQAIQFSPDGMKMFITSHSTVYQYSLTSAYAITTASLDDSYNTTTLLPSHNLRTMAFSGNGETLFLLGITYDLIVQLHLSAPYDITGEITYEGQSFDISDEEGNPSGIAFNRDGSRLFLVGGDFDRIYQYDLNIGSYTEASINDGSIEGTGGFQISGDQFSNAGSTLSQGVDYSIANLPSGLSTSIEVGDNGLYATLSISGSATNHQDINDVSGLTFTFNNSAFVGGDASSVTNATSTDSGISIDFNDNNPEIKYDFSYLFDPEKLTLDNTLSVFSQETSLTGMQISADGKKLFVIGTIGDDVNQYSLSTAFDLSTAVFETAYSISTEEVTPQDIAFSEDGSKMFVIGNNRNVYQYSLSNAFDISSGVSYDGTPYSVVSQEASPRGLTFNVDGTKMFIVGASGDEVNQYSLSNAFDITSGVTYDGSPFDISSETGNPYAIAFNESGTEMLITSSTTVFHYQLTTPYDITSGVVKSDKTLTFLGRFPGGITWSADGTKLYLAEADYNNVYEYSLPSGYFTEVSDNLGEVEGSLPMELVDDFFVNAGGTLTEGVHFNLPNKPAGLSASIAVDANGQTTTLTFTDAANNHQAINTVNPLEITFLNAAFENSTALQVANAVEANTGVSIDFRDNNPAITYGSAFNLENASFEGKGSIGGSYLGMTTNSDGSRLFFVENNNNRVYQIIPGSNYDVIDGLSFGDNIIASDLSRLSGIEFNADGTKMFLLDYFTSVVGQYSLSSAFDITTATYSGSFDVSNEEVNPYAMTFDPSGNKMYIAGYNNDVIHQYTLTNSFDVLSTVTYDGSPLSIKSYEDFIYDMEFGDGGSKLYITGSSSDAVHTLQLETAYDITGTVELIHTFDVSGEHTAPVGLILGPNGGKLFVQGFNSGVAEYDMGIGGFSEVESNNGEVEGELLIQIIDETFANPGGSLTYSTDYTMLNVPNGLTPSISVAADGFSATVTFSGTANDHQDIHDVSSLGFDFNNSAFSGGNASAVANAESAESGIGIDFEDNNGTLSYGYKYSIANGAEPKDFFNLIDFDSSPQDLAFSNDGLTMFIVGNTNNAILQFSLDEPYKINAGITQEGSFDYSGYDVTPTGISFNASGSKMYVTGLQNDAVNQFSLTTPFDITSGVTHDGTPLTDINNIRTVAFNDDGTIFFVMAGITSASIIQYEVSTPYDLTSGVSQVDGFSVSLSNPRGLAFSENGFEMFFTSYDDIIRTYRLAKPFDLKTDPIATETYDVSDDTYWANGIAFSTSGDKLITLSGRSGFQRVTEYELNIGGFSETFENDGEVEGSIVIRAFDAQFASAGGTLSPSTDYSLTGVPAGLTSSLSVAADGLSATLSLSGTASDHQNLNDVDDFTFTFNSSAFETLAASLVNNTSSFNSGLGVDFLDNNPAIQYGNAFNVLVGTTYSENSFDAGSDPLDVTFSPDGTKMYITNFNDQLVQYSLSEPYNVSTATANTPSFSLNADEVTTGIAFSADGMKLFTAANSRLIHQYSLANPFDITSGVTDDEVPFDILNQETSPAGITFSVDGTKMYIVGSGSDEVNQYSLANPFDISTGVTFDGSPYSIASEETQSADIELSRNGRKMLIIGYDNDQVYQYNLSIPFDITQGVSYDGSYDISDEEGQSSGFAFNASGNKLFVIGRDNDTVFEYNLNVGSFEETELNDGDVEGSVTLFIYDDTFANGGSTLTHTSDYTINNLPAGLTPSLSVAADGLSATLSVSGQVSDHQAIHSVDGLEFTFANSAFVTNNAAEVAGAVAANSYLPVLLRDNVPALTYGDFYSFSNLSFDGFFDVSSEDDIPTNIAFSNDGSKMFITGRINDAIYQYALTNAFDVTSGVTFEGSLDISVDTRDAMDLQFSPDGMTLLVLSDNVSSNFGSLIAQYNLTQAFDITSGVTYSGNSFDLPSSTLSNPSGFTFSADGAQVFVANGFHSSEIIYFYTLNSPFDISGGLTYDGSFSYPVESESLYDLAFNADGSSLFILFGPLSDQVDELILETPYDLTSGFEIGQSYSVSSAEDFPQGFIFGPNGNKMYVVGATGDEVNQYTLTDEGFVENSANDGSIDGSLQIKLIDDFFANAGGSLSSPGDYSISNLPSGLSPSLNVDPNGQIATLTLTGNAISHPDAGDINSLEFTFENSAFVNYDAAEVTRAVTASSGVGIDFIANADTDILMFSLAEETGTATIDATNHTVEIEVIFGTDVSTLSPSITVSDGATISPESEIENDFSSPVTYTVTAENGVTNQDWEVTVAIAPNTENDIESFTFTEISGSAVIDAGAHTVTSVAVAGTDISALAPNIGISQNATVSPDSGVEQDFTSPITYTVTAEDGTPQDWEVTVAEEEVAPTDIMLTSTSVDENSTSGTIVAELSTLDQNFDETFTYFVVAELGSDDWQSFDIDGSNLVTTDFISLDFETKNEFTFELEVRDSENEAYSEIVTITLNDVNEAPTNILLSNTSVDESNPSGTFVGALSPVDQDNGDSHTYSLKEGNVDNASFTINNSDLITNTELDFETQSIYNLEIIVTDQEGLSFEQEFGISVNNLPAQITSLELSNSSVDENASIGYAIGSFAAFGEDLSGSFVYSLVAGSGSDDNASFDISSDQLLVNSSLDFETQDSYSIRVMVDDGSLTFEKAFTISVNDVSEAPTDITLSNTSIAENNQIGDAIGTLSTTDEDAGESFTYSLVSGAGDTNNTSFSIVGNELQAAEVFDFETQNSYSVRIETNDGNGGTFSKSFTIDVANQNESILVANPIADQNLDEHFTTVEIDLSNVFEDQDGDVLTYTVSSDDETIVTVGNSGALLTIAEVGSFGSATITVTADDGSGVTTSDSFIVTVINVNDAPVVDNAIEDQSENEGFESIELNLSATFSDEDGDDLTLSVSSSDETVSTASISGTTLTLTEVGNGTTDITVTANDGNGGTVANEFTLTVNNVNDSPIVANAISDQDVNEGFGSIEIDISSTFSDEDGDNLTLSVSSGDEAVVTVSLSGTTLTISEIGIGSTIVSVTANDGNGGTVSDNFAVIVNNVNDAPVVANTIADQAQQEGFGSINIDLTNTFSDADGDALTLSVVSSDAAVATASISGTTLTLIEAGIGSSTITVTANDGNGESISDEFILTVDEAPNNAPVVANAIADQSEEEGFGSITLDLSNTFSDADGDVLTLSVVSSDETVANVGISGTTLTLTEAGIGTSTITVTANDGNGGSVSDEFSIEVIEAPNNAPIVANPIGDQSPIEEGFGSITISYNRVFNDPDGDALTISVSSSDESVVTARLDANEQIQINEVGLGTSTIKLTADDGNGGVVSNTFTFTVERGLGFENSLDVKAYPNPVVDFLRIESIHEVEVCLFDLNGRKISSGNGQSIQLDMRSTESGAYILKVSNEKGSTTKRIIKAN